MNEDERELAPGLRDLLADESTWAEPEPGGADALLAAIRSMPPAEAAPAPEPEPLPGAVVPLAPRRRRRPWVLAAAAMVVAVVGAVGVVVALSREEADEGREVAIGGTELAPDASATAVVEQTPSGVAIELDVRGLPPSEPGTYYQGWVRAEDGRTVTIGTFHVRGGDDVVELWSGVDVDEYPTLTVTLQEEGAGPASSGRVVLTGRIG